MAIEIRERMICETCEGKGVVTQPTGEKAACVRCYGVGTRPAPLQEDELSYDRGEVMAEAFARGGAQGWYDMQDEWSEYRSGTGAHADPVQRSIEANWAKEHDCYQYDPLGRYDDSDY